MNELVDQRNTRIFRKRKCAHLRQQRECVLIFESRCRIDIRIRRTWFNRGLIIIIVNETCVVTQCI